MHITTWQHLAQLLQDPGQSSGWREPYARQATNAPEMGLSENQPHTAGAAKALAS